uniref:Acyl-CoA thioesterase II domain-containing protein n=1 Tax=Trichuris muris TaxID=70415 RepID=A0A5S6Q8J3_TRIMR
MAYQATVTLNVYRCELVWSKRQRKEQRRKGKVSLRASQQVGSNFPYLLAAQRTWKVGTGEISVVHKLNGPRGVIARRVKGSEPMLRHIKRHLCVFVGGRAYSLPDLLKGVERLDKHVYRLVHGGHFLLINCPSCFRSNKLMEGVVASQRIFGGQMLGQAVYVACNAMMHTQPLVPRSLHVTFTKGGSVNHPLLFVVNDNCSSDHSRKHCTVSVTQRDSTIISINMELQPAENEETSAHEDAIPSCPPPEELPKHDAWFHSYLKMRNADELDYMIVDMMTKGISHTFDNREVDKFYVDDLQLPRNVFWVKAHESLDQREHLVHHAVVSYISDTLMIAAALRPHVSFFSDVSQIASLNHCMWFHHKQINISDWMLYETISTVASGARAFVTGRLWSRQGKLVMTATQEALIRVDSSSKRN